MKKLVSIFIGLSACVAPDQQIEVKVAGNLRSIMMQGDYRAAIGLDTLANKPNLYALGAAAQLDGEVLVWDSKPLITRPEADTFSLTSTWDADAALLVYAQVKGWNTSTVQEELTMEQLADLLEQKIGNNGEATPFLIHATADELRWHVVNGKNLEGQSHATHAASGYQAKVKSKEVALLGFYSRHHEGVFTHRGQFTHIHFKTTDGKAAGHVDQFRLSAGSSLSIPQKL